MKITLLLFVFIVSLNADLIQRDKVIEKNFVLQISSCISEKCVDKTKSIIKDEIYFTNKLNTTYIVNIKTKKDALLLQSKYKEIFPDTIVRRRFSEDKKLINKEHI